MLGSFIKPLQYLTRVFWYYGFLVILSRKFLNSFNRRKPHYSYKFNFVFQISPIQLDLKKPIYFFFFYANEYLFSQHSFICIRILMCGVSMPYPTDHRFLLISGLNLCTGCFYLTNDPISIKFLMD